MPPTLQPLPSLDALNVVEQNAAERIPAEILIDIFTYIRPVYKCSRHRWIRSDTPSYKVALARFARLRLVSRFWNQTITPVIHSEAVISTLPIEALLKSLKFLDHGAEHIKSLILVDDTVFYNTGKPGISREAKELLAQSLSSKCSSSNIQTMECYGISHAFLKWAWIPKTLPNLPSTTKNLVLRRVSTPTLSHALISLGRSIQRLEVHSWYIPPELRYGPFHLPTEMPLLQDITLVNGSPSPMEIQKLFSRVGNTRKSASRHNFPLRSLTLKNVATIGVEETLSILRTNSIGKNIVSLFLEPPLFLQPPRQYWPTAYPIAIVKECPSLVKFSYLFPIKKDLFVHLPPTLRHLHLAIIFNQHRFPMSSGREDSLIGNAAGFAEAVEVRQYSLEKLQISTCHEYRQYRQSSSYRDSTTSGQHSALQEACDSAGVTLLWTEYEE
ncbi:uncharacterized protein LACBIDRAFT_334997 [Laccaria bicolor S238N-H82]|uniref:Predicted protein n=1 Tax=Laccaria bicolor (strain S238N-H82 / ATCC MYA-4686) TaxID=486041 RepID=B0E111_LACBS|nr:uncharacterized protein LACBIDRAFT_334997 [Laccaria bicolor S238N-H82]EDQ99534.1 predicted protein [Laccaria bicolor S238N-H82]|eukprot:XP_001889883.1 predicted protein [Laccaria bicolor S238N-H82]